MPVNLEGTNAGDELLAAIDGTEQEPTDELDVTAENETEAGDEGDEPEENAEEDEADAQAGDDEDDDGTARYTVPGQDAKVTLKELTEGYMKDADYRRKTAAIADEKRQVGALGTEYAGGLETLKQQLTAVATFVATQINAEEAEMDRLVAENPAEAVKLQRELGKKGNLLQNIHAQLQNVQQAQGENARKQAEAFRTAEQAKLLEVAPEFRKPETSQRLHAYLKDTYGLDQEVIDSVTDHRFTVIAEKARRYDAIKAKGALKEKQVKQAPGKFQKGGAAQRGGDASKARDKAFKTVMNGGKVNDLANLF